MKIAFSDFWDGFDPQNNFILSALRLKFDMEVVSMNQSDYLIYSSFGNHHTRFKGVRIFFTGENLVPDFNWCDYAIGFHHLSFSDRYLRLPLYALYDEFDLLFDSPKIEPTVLLNRPFCSFVFSNSRNADPAREHFFHLLSRYKQVDSGGGLLNNVGGRVKSKMEFISRYKFNIAFENSNSPGYTTEKLMEALAARTLPIYYGNNDVGSDFNINSFVRADQFESFDALAEHIVYLDKHDDAYLNIMQQKPLIHEQYKNAKQLLLDFLTPIFEGNSIRHSKRVTEYGFRKHYARSHQRLTWLDNHRWIDKVVRIMSKTE